MISVDGRPVAVLGPYRKRQWVSKDEYLRVLQTAGDDPTFFDDIADMPGGFVEADVR